MTWLRWLLARLVGVAADPADRRVPYTVTEINGRLHVHTDDGGLSWAEAKALHRAIGTELALRAAADEIQKRFAGRSAAELADRHRPHPN